jgi:hypothetical protein
MRSSFAAALLLSTLGVMAPPIGETRAASPPPMPDVPPYPGPLRSRDPRPKREPTAAEISADAKRRRRNANRLATTGASR